LERDSLITYRPANVHVQAARPAPWLPSMQHALNPPASKRVLESLASCLTPPHAAAFGAASRATKSAKPRRDGVGLRTLDPGLQRAYEACTQVTRRYSKSFYFSARLLPPGKRQGIMALYAFCRLTDNLVDDADAGEQTEIARLNARLALNSWARATCGSPKVDHPVIEAWADTRERFGVPQALADELVEGVRMDLTIGRYGTWDDLWVYCYRVASTVGLMSMYITGAETMQAVPYAVQLGVALQLTNILRDVGEDARAGRIYLPREDMERFGYTEEMLMEGRINGNFRRLMDFEIARARVLYETAWPGIAMLPADSRLAVAAAGQVYRGILDKIVDANYDVFNHRAHLSTGEKLRALPKLWLKVKMDQAIESK
jgi:phytoene synthase